MKSIPHPNIRRTRGFTLVELLVVITLIVVLAGVTFFGASTFLKRAAAEVNRDLGLPDVQVFELIERFGSQVADLVDGLTKLDKLHFTTREENQAESFRKMLLAMARDVRVILIKLADRTHNMRTMGDMPKAKWGRISSETLEIYAPIAHRLGLNHTYRELQDLAFRFLHPWRYEVLGKALSKARGRRKDLISRVRHEVEAAFEKHGVHVRIMGREKTLYSVYRKMDLKHLSFSQVTDIYGFRIVVKDVQSCYITLGLLHGLYKPIPGKFKDYIAIPKANGYQSLHTHLFGPFGSPIEMQIRTQEMHKIAEAGVASHWLYKSADQSITDLQKKTHQWLQSLLEMQSESGDSVEFLEHLKVDLFPDEVYVFTPKGKIMALPRGVTAVDFAYAVHSDLGDSCVGAKVNGRIAPLHRELKNGDTVEVLTKGGPNKATEVLLYTMYTEAFKRAKASEDEAQMAQLDFAYRREQLYFEILLDVRDATERRA